jgi:hypothetical protein
MTEQPIQIGQFYDGDDIVKLYRIDVEQVEKVREIFPSISCRHSYDCCANWYPNTGCVIHIDSSYEYAIVQQRYIQNI